MIKLEKFTGNKTYMYPNGTIAQPERIKRDFPAVEHFTHVIEVNGNVCQAVMELAALRQMHNIDDSLTEEEAIQAIQDILNAPEPEAEPTPEERIAAAMEFQNMMLL
jgi:hypothetical protein